MSEPQSQRRRMELPKKREDLEKIVEEVEGREQASYHEEHEHHHEHYHEGELEDVVSVLELLIDSLSANVKTIESSVSVQADEIVRLYKVLAKIVEACGATSEDEKREALTEAVKLLKEPG